MRNWFIQRFSMQRLSLSSSYHPFSSYTHVCTYLFNYKHTHTHTHIIYILFVYTDFKVIYDTAVSLFAT
uniref:Uncharacterized protein n=1 Tax=Octopus bimaculoides TaxID=37653 RepID=A0A0L8FZY0_OCTBM